MFGLPSTVAVHQPLPKQAFYQRLSLSSAVKDEFVHSIESLCVVGAIKKATCGIPAAEGIDEVSVLRVDLKTGEIPHSALDAIVAAVPRKLLMACCHEGRARLAVVRGDLRVSERWIAEEELHIELKGASLVEVWDGLCAQVLFDDANVEDVDARMAKEKKIVELEAEVAKLERRYAKEVQPAKRNAAFKAFRAAKASLLSLKGE
ncbi:MAG: DUF4391 domain-containing protein [Slackia sp.]|nr:DUF4391 domain-containing protein [Slackia sp.]